MPSSSIALTKDGKLRYDNTIMDMHSCAAIAKGLKAKRINGYDYWYVIREGRLTPIQDIREEYRKTIA